MDTLIAFLFFCQALGASVGAGTAVWSELAYVRAMHDGRVDHAERAHLDVIAHGLRFGMMLLLLASLGLVVVAYLQQAPQQPVLSASYWTFITLALLIIVVSWAHSKHLISFALSSALVFTAWWFLVYLTFGLLPAITFGAAIACFIVATAIFYGLFHYLRLFALHKQ